MIKLVVTDLDGTLLNQEKRVTEENRSSITRLREQGISLCLCTGRIYGSAAMISEELGNDFPIISCNGALIKDPLTNHSIYKYTMDNALAIEILDRLQRYDIVYHFYNENTVFSNKLAYAAKTYYDKFANSDMKRVDVVIQDDLRDRVDSANGINKFILFTEDPKIKEKITSDIIAIQGIDISQSSRYNIEISGRGISKGHGLKKLKEIYSLESDEIFVIGDEMNDLSMFGEATYSVAMGNGDARLKEKAFYVTKANDQSGFASAVNRIVFGEEG